MKDKLFKLNTFCGANGIEYTLTGTMALQLLGLPCSKPQDLDILVHHASDGQLEKLKELQFLSGLEDPVYENTKSFSFIIDGVKVNAIIDDTKSYATISQHCVNIMLIDEKCAERHHINVHTALPALKAK